MLSLLVNGKAQEVDTDADTPLLWVLRDRLGLTGTKYACGIAVCGACIVLVDGRPVRSCVMSAGSVRGKRITTIEGLSPDRSHAVQKAWIEEDVPQCGYCQSGQILAAVALLAARPNPTDADIDEALRDVLCRCGTYNRVRRAIKKAAAMSRKGV
jgi:aerobic-type carbon monoxide dehydrogenase small subunit (CoxS/CutS family)